MPFLGVRKGTIVTPLTSLVCQDNSEFLALKTGVFLEWTGFWCEKDEKMVISEVVENQSLPFSLHKTNLSKLCNEVVKAMEWSCHSYALRASDATSEWVKA